MTVTRTHWTRTSVCASLQHSLAEPGFVLHRNTDDNSLLYLISQCKDLISRVYFLVQYSSFNSNIAYSMKHDALVSINRLVLQASIDLLQFKTLDLLLHAFQHAAACFSKLWCTLFAGCCKLCGQSSYSGSIQVKKAQVVAAQLCSVKALLAACASSSRRTMQALFHAGCMQFLHAPHLLTLGHSCLRFLPPKRGSCSTDKTAIQGS